MLNSRAWVQKQAAASESKVRLKKNDKYSGPILLVQLSYFESPMYLRIILVGSLGSGVGKCLPAVPAVPVGHADMGGKGLGLRPVTPPVALAKKL